MIPPASGKVKIFNHAPVSTKAISTVTGNTNSMKLNSFTGLKKQKFRLRKRTLIPAVAIVFCIIAFPVLLRALFLKACTDMTTLKYKTSSISIDRTTSNPLESFLTVKRNEWNASPPKIGIKELTTPIKRIIVAHTADKDELCNSLEECKIRVKAIQDNNAHLMDIPYNFLIGADGNVYEGRGYFYEGEHTANLNATSYNDVGICIAFIGVFQFQKPTQAQINAFEMFVEHNVNDGMIVQDYKLFFQSQLVKPVISADGLYEVLQSWKNFHSVIKIYRRDEWDAFPRCRPSPQFGITNSHVMLTHTVQTFCTTITQCSDRLKNLQAAIQKDCTGVTYQDINFGFMIGGDGLIFEGRGFDNFGEHTFAYNDRCLGIGYIGNFDNYEPSQDMIDASFHFFNDAVALGKLSENFSIHARQDFSSAGPGLKFYDVMKSWPRYSSKWDQNN